MLPVVGYYFSMRYAPALNKSRSGVSGVEGEAALVEVEVQFLCTPSLTADFKAAGELWGMVFDSMKPSVSQHHKSPLNSDQAALASKVGLHDSFPTSAGAPESTTLSEESTVWLQATYREDIHLYEHYCSSKGHHNETTTVLKSPRRLIFLCPVETTLLPERKCFRKHHSRHRRSYRAMEDLRGSPTAPIPSQ